MSHSHSLSVSYGSMAMSLLKKISGHKLGFEALARTVLVSWTQVVILPRQGQASCEEAKTTAALRKKQLETAAITIQKKKKGYKE